MVADPQLPDRGHVLERRRQLPKLLDVLRPSRRFVAKPAPNAVQDPLSFGRAHRTEVAHHANREPELVHAYIIADASP